MHFWQCRQILFSFTSAFFTALNHFHVSAIHGDHLIKSQNVQKGQGAGGGMGQVTDWYGLTSLDTVQIDDVIGLKLIVAFVQFLTFWTS